MEFCDFCEDEKTPSIGKMLVVEEGGTEELFPGRFRACLPCGHGWTGRTVAHHPVTGQVAVFQFEHQDFHKVAGNVDTFAFYLDSVKCQACDVKLYGAVEPLRDIALRMLRACPEVDHLVGTCGPCSEKGLCGDCDDPNHEH